MGLFDAMFGQRKEAQLPPPTAPTPSDDQLGVLVALSGAPALTGRDGATVQRRELAARVELDGLVLDALHVRAPLPAALIDRLSQVTHWREDAKARLRDHDQHLIVWFAGGSDDPIEQYIALIRAGEMLGGRALQGIVLEPAVNFLPASFVPRMTGPEGIRSMRERVPIGILTGMIKVGTEDGLWMATRGHEVFGVPNFATLAPPHVPPSQVKQLFQGLFDYARSGARLELGQTIDIGPSRYRFDPVVEYKSHVEGGGETFVLTPLDVG